MNKIFAIFSAMAVVATPFYGAMQKKADSKKPNPCASLESGMGLPMDNSCYPAGYNAPANIKLGDQIDITGQASFIYWFVGQDNMTVGTKSSTDSLGVKTYRALEPSSEFAPGFKVGGAIDMKYDDWRMFADYTWLHESTSHHSPIGSGAEVTGFSSGLLGITSVNSKWKMHLDMLDVGFNRAYYRSKRMTLSPVAGLKALWIRQNLNVQYLTAQTPYNTYNTKSHSWAIGPMLGTNAHWLFCHGLRLEGKASAAIVYTRYTQLTKDKQFVTNPSRSIIPNYNSVNPMAELGMGFGWGRYLDNQNYYIDLSARYDFNIFWNQNQMIGGGGDLYMHGLTLTGRFDF